MALLDLSALLARPALAGTRWSVEVRLGAEVVADYRPERLLRSASLGKLFLLVEVADRLERGLLDPGQPVRRDRVDPVADSGLWQHLATVELPLADVATLVGSVSDNWATNALVDLVGLDAVRERARSLAPGGSTLHDLVRDSRGPHDPPTLSEGCAADHARLAAGLAGLPGGAVVDPAVARRVVGWLVTGTDLSMVASALLLDPLAHTAADGPDHGVRLWNKTGTDSRVRGDVGVLTGPAGTAAYAVIGAWEPGADRRAAVMGTMHEIGAGLARLVGAPGAAVAGLPPRTPQ